MVFIFGGRSQGKLQYAKEQYGDGLTVSDLKECNISDLKECNIKDATSADILINIQEAVKSMLCSGENPSGYFRQNIEKFSGKILIGDEIGSGIVPVDAFEREWRDETGWVYQFLVLKAERVDRVWAGIGQTLKQQEIRA